MSIDRRRLGHTIVRLRKQAGLAQAQLGERSRIPRSTIAMVETGTPPSLWTAVALADALGVTVDDLIEEAR